MARMCAVCNHPNRVDIEQTLLNLHTASSGATIGSIAEDYGLTEQAVRVHAMMHAPVTMQFSEKADQLVLERLSANAGEGQHSEVDPPKRMVDDIKLREGEMLISAANQYLVTLNNIGRRINRYASSNDPDDMRLEKLVTGHIVNLYLGAGSELRQTIKSIVEMNSSINGAKDGNAAGLIALADALKASGGDDDD